MIEKNFCIYDSKIDDYLQKSNDIVRRIALLRLTFIFAELLLLTAMVFSYFYFNRWYGICLTVLVVIQIGLLLFLVFNNRYKKNVMKKIQEFFPQITYEQNGGPINDLEVFDFFGGAQFESQDCFVVKTDDKEILYREIGAIRGCGEGRRLNFSGICYTVDAGLSENELKSKLNPLWNTNRYNRDEIRYAVRDSLCYVFIPFKERHFEMPLIGGFTEDYVAKDLQRAEDITIDCKKIAKAIA
jgi:hypothetical protein